MVLLGNGAAVSGSYTTGGLAPACEKSPPRSAAVGTEPSMLLPRRPRVVAKVTVKEARCQFTILGMCKGPPILAFRVSLEEYGFCTALPLSENGAALSAEFLALIASDPVSGGVVRRRFPKLANWPLKGP